MNDLGKYIGNRIRYYRETRNLTQDELAEELDTTRQSISRYESGDRKTNQDLLFKLADIFNVSINEFFPNQNKDKEGITAIYNELEPPRQQKVYNFAERELEEQRYIQDHDDYVGQTAAGEPIEGQQPVPMLGSETVRLLVNGDSMEPDFHDGDIIEYHPKPELENGEIGVFAVNGGVTMKKFRKNDDIRLESLNKKYKDIVIQETDDFSILGKVII